MWVHSFKNCPNCCSWYGANIHIALKFDSVKDKWYDSKLPTGHLPFFVSTTLVVHVVLSWDIWENPMPGSMPFNFVFNPFSFCWSQVTLTSASWRSDFIPTHFVFSLSSSLVLLTATLIMGSGTIFDPSPFLCHFCSSEVHSRAAFWSVSWHRSLLDWHSNTVNLHSFSNNARVWLQYPTSPLPSLHL